MCGIAGVVSENLRTLDSDRLSYALDAISHRGPDGIGEYQDGYCHLGMTRLAIVDLVNGSQPYISRSNRTVVVFNGEIYNYKELARKDNFYQQGVTTEASTIADLYERYHENCFSMFDGFFAIAIWDVMERRLILARDKIGKKPLFYGIHNSDLYFGSEIKALLKLGFPISVNQRAIVDVLKYGYPRIPNTSYQGVYQVPPAHFIDYFKGTVRAKKFWRVEEFDSLDEISFSEAKARVNETLLRAVEKRLLAERPLGIFLSGGIDSSLIATSIRQLGRTDIETFSVGFHHAKYDESKYAREISLHLGLKHNQVTVEPDPDFFIQKYTKYMDYPFADSSFLPTFLLSEFSSRSIKVALSGDGGDESFGGYNRYIMNLKVQKLASLFPSSALPNIVLKNRLWNKFYRSLKERNFTSRYDSMMRLLDDQNLRKALNSDFFSDNNSHKTIDFGYRNKGSSGNLLEMQLDDLSNYLPGDLLVKMDMASMSNGLEVRSPFLDTSVIQLGLALPVKFKIRGSSGKYILRELLADSIPRPLFERPKQGFAIPRAEWLRGPLRDTTRDILLSNECKNRGWFNPSYVKKILELHDQGWDLDEIIWPLMMVELWAINWIDRH
jgi:asparagine synthase (glutamine-hydrolysing)